jgi:hypothetical protein
MGMEIRKERQEHFILLEVDNSNKNRFLTHSLLGDTKMFRFFSMFFYFSSTFPLVFCFFSWAIMILNFLLSRYT